MDTFFKSCLFTPANFPDRFPKAFEVGADLLIIDLEDSIAPKDKEIARSTALNFLKSNKFPKKTALRVNGLTSLYGLQDVSAILSDKYSFDYLMIPKLENIETCYQLAELFKNYWHKIKVIGLIETATGLNNINEFTKPPEILAGLMLGAADLSSDLDCEITSSSIEEAKCSLVRVCAQAKLLSIDSPNFAIRDIDGLRTATKEAHDLGFTCKAAIHPSQIPIINTEFSPTDEEISEALEVLRINKQGVGVINGHMIDEAIAKKARHTLLLAGKEIA